MSSKKKLTIILLLMIFPIFGFSQSINKKPNVNSTQHPSWKAINVFPDHNNIMQSHPNDVGTPVLTNIKEGVSFYKRPCKSTTEKTMLLKVINSNSYSVKVSWKLSSSSSPVSVVVPANSGIKGSCKESLNENTSKLTIIIPSDADAGKMKKYMLSHLTVTKLN